MSPVNKELRIKAITLISPETEKQHLASFINVLDTGFKIALSLKGHKFKSDSNGEGFLLFQMILSTGLSIKHLYQCVDYTNSFDEEINFNALKDPFSIMSLVRGQLEKFCTYNHIFVNSENDEIKLFRYNLWVIVGLQIRQQSVKEGMSEENKEKAKREKTQIETLKKRVEGSPFYKQLTDKKKRYFDSLISYEFKIDTTIENLKLSYRSLFERAGMKIDLLNDFYSLLSNYVHPSNVSVFQFRELYKDGEFIHSSNRALNFSKIIIAFMIRDFCYLNPIAFKAFETLDIPTQSNINCLNTSLRGKNFALNDSFKNI